MKILLHPFSLFIRRTSRLGLRTNARILKGTLDEKRQAEYLQHRRFSTFDQIGEALEPEAKLHSERWNSTKALLGKVCHEIGHRQILKIQDVAAETRERQEEEEEEKKEEEETKKKKKKKKEIGLRPLPQNGQLRLLRKRPSTNFYRNETCFATNYVRVITFRNIEVDTQTLNRFYRMVRRQAEDF